MAYPQQKKGADKKDRNGNDNGNTITIQKCKQAATQSGFDNNQGQECENLICTHPGENATCVQEGVVAAQAQVNKTQPVKLTCEQCFTKFLTTSSQMAALRLFFLRNTLEEMCALIPVSVTEADFQRFLAQLTGSESTAAQIIQCLIDAGVQFRSTAT